MGHNRQLLKSWFNGPMVKWVLTHWENGWFNSPMVQWITTWGKLMVRWFNGSRVVVFQCFTGSMDLHMGQTIGFMV